MITYCRESCGRSSFAEMVIDKQVAGWIKRGAGLETCGHRPCNDRRGEAEIQEVKNQGHCQQRHWVGKDWVGTEILELPNFKCRNEK
jgi:hypothetical protein